MSIDIRNLSWEVGNKSIIENISLTINRGEIITILGPNGAGKSSFLRLISGDLKGSKGEIFFDESNLDEISIQDRSFMRSVMSQSQEIVYDFSVKEIIEMGWIERGISTYSGDFEEAVNRISLDCSVNDLLEQSFNTLSGGEKRRVHFARTLIQVWNDNLQNDPSFMFLDEPTSNLDLYHELKLLKILKNESKKGKGILLIIHNLNLAFKFSDKIGIFKNGKLLSFGEPKEVFTNEILFDVFKIPIKVNSKNRTLNIY